MTKPKNGAGNEIGVLKREMEKLSVIANRAERERIAAARRVGMHSAPDSAEYKAHVEAAAAAREARAAFDKGADALLKARCRAILGRIKGTLAVPPDQLEKATRRQLIGGVKRALERGLVTDEQSLNSIRAMRRDSVDL